MSSRRPRLNFAVIRDRAVLPVLHLNGYKINT
jgi:phosphoketolase